MRGIFENPRVSAPTTGAPPVTTPTAPPPRRTVGTGRLLSPGMFVRIRLPIGKPHQALLVIDRAIQSDQGLKYVYVVDAENKAQYRRVTTAALQPDGLRVVEGLKKDDLVLVGALQQIRAKMEVKPERRPMPSITAAADDEGAEPKRGKE